MEELQGPPHSAAGTLKPLRKSCWPQEASLRSQACGLPAGAGAAILPLPELSFLFLAAMAPSRKSKLQLAPLGPKAAFAKRLLGAKAASPPARWGGASKGPAPLSKEVGMWQSHGSQSKMHKASVGPKVTFAKGSVVLLCLLGAAWAHEVACARGPGPP